MRALIDLAASEQIQILTSFEILEELAGVLAEKIQLSDQRIEELNLS